MCILKGYWRGSMWPHKLQWTIVSKLLLTGVQQGNPGQCLQTVLWWKYRRKARLEATWGICFKIECWCSIFQGANSFSTGIVLRDYQGAFVEAKNLCLPVPAFIFEAEAIRIREALSWLMSWQHPKLCIELDSLVTMQAIQDKGNQLKVGLVICSW